MLSRLQPLLVTLAIFTAACTIKETPEPPLTGPSEFGVSLSISVEDGHDVLVRGVDTATVIVTAKDDKNQPLDIEVLLEIVVDGEVTDFGTLSQRRISTGADGIVTATYTPPAMSATSKPTELVTIRARTIGTNYQLSKAQVVNIRLINFSTVDSDAPKVRIYASQTTAKIDEDIVFNGREHSVTPPATRIESYSWNWGDPSPVDTRTTPDEEHDYATAGTFWVILTVRDDKGREGSDYKQITITP